MIPKEFSAGQCYDTIRNRIKVMDRERCGFEKDPSLLQPPTGTFSVELVPSGHPHWASSQASAS